MAQNKRVSMIDVARAAGVSHQTVSRVINNSPDVSAATRVKVMDVIDKLEYRPSNAARALVTSKSHTIGLIIGESMILGVKDIVSAIESSSKSRGYFLSLSMVNEVLCTQSDIDLIVKGFDEQNIDGLIIIASTDAMFSASCKLRSNIPRVILTSTHGSVSIHEGRSLLKQNSSSSVSKFSFIGVNQWRAMADVVSVVNSSGHRDALYVAGPLMWRDAATRLSAWNKISQANSMRSRIMQCTSWKSSESYSRMNHVIEQCGVEGAQLPSVIVAASDLQAIGVIRSLYEHGFKVPADVSVVGFGDDCGMCDLFPPLTTVNIEPLTIGSLAVREMMRLIHGVAELVFADMAHGVGLNPASVVLRASLGKPNYIK